MNFGFRREEPLRARTSANPGASGETAKRYAHNMPRRYEGCKIVPRGNCCSGGRIMDTTHTAVRTRDHDEIRHWVEDRGGFPATVKATSEDHHPGLLRIDFPDYSGGETLKRI